MSNTLQTLISLLRQKNLTTSFAESCTGGKLSSLMTEQAGVSDVFVGAVVSYSNQAKQDLLEVRTETLATFGAVSVEVAREMALGAKKKLKSNVSVAITGVAGPSGGSAEKPVGTVCFAVAGPGFFEPGFENSTTRHFAGNRIQIQEQSAEFAMNFLVNSVTKAMK